ncbi:hypothetical protein RHGRI_030085 [Rhododendron griersonianum]|uniref:Pesticidal crystal cry8Ba protein n=1 Tax=Rhododendron griersonianum TaxID=479676 RepID=A0AAV6IS26_9ERIC|nr:hypothetical protein RHGRI_030085 [Rhododendron griersonianum]
MFAEARDNGARRWVKEGFAKKRDSPFSDPVFGKYGLSHKMPSTAKFQSGHLPSGIIPVSKAVPVASGSGSDMDTCSDSDDDVVYGARYSLDSSPQDDKIPIGVGPMHTNYVNRNANYATVSVRKQGHGIGDGDSSDSVTSSRVYYQSVRLQPNENTKGKQDSHGRRLQNKVLFDGIPSAPPCAYSAEEINQAADQIPTFVANGAPCPDSSYCSSTTDEPNPNRSIPAATTVHDTTTNRIHDRSLSAGGGAEAATCSSSLPAQRPTYHASGLGPWCAVISYDACVRLCLYSWARGCEEAPMFLENECMLLRSTFGLQQVVLQPEEELLSNPAKELNSEGAAVRPKKTFGKMKVQVRKVKLASDLPIGCSFSSLKPPMAKKMESLRFHMSKAKSTLSSGWGALRQVRVAPQIPANSSFSRQSLAYVHAGTRYVQEVSGILKSSVINFRNTSSSYEEVQETYSCLLRLKSSSEEDAVRMQPSSGETHVFLPDGLGDDLILEVHDSKGKYCGRVVAQVAAIAEDPGDKLRWWSLYQEPEHELVGRIQLYISYTTSLDESSHPKCGSVAETVAYDLVLEVAMKVQDFKPRNLLLHGSWKWLVTEFASYYGVSDAYTKLRYLSYIMDVATPTADCLSLVHDLLAPVIMKGRVKGALSHQENRILGEVHDRIEDILALVFENYKSLDESSESGMVDVFKPATGLAAPALEPALKLYNLMHDILSSEAQLKLCRYFQVAAKKRSRMHLLETDEFVSSNTGSTLMDSVALSTAYQKMKSLCFSMKNEIYTDIQIHNLDVLPSFIELPSLLSSIYSVELCKRLREFLIACPPNGPSPPVTDLVIAAADFQKDLALWNIGPTKGGVDAKELFHFYITRWIQDKRLALLESCKLDKVKWSNNQTQHSTTPFVDDMYDQLKETLSEYEVITCRWPEYTFVLEKAITDVEKAIVDTLDKQYAEVLSPLKENLSPIKFGIKYVQKIATGTVCPYSVPEELGILLNSFKWMLDILRPKIEAQLKSWGSCTIDGGNVAPGEYLSEVTVMLRTKFRNYLQAVVEKLAENTRMQNETKLKKIIQESKDTVLESDIRNRMQPLKDLLMKTIDHLHTVFETQIFIIICRGFWDRMGQDMLRFLENRNENKSCYKGSRVAVSILDDTFASQMQQLIGNALQEKDLEPPRSIMAVRSMLCKDTVNHNDNNYYY